MINRGRTDFVYIAVSKGNPDGPIKVGYTTQPDHRPRRIMRDKKLELDYAYIIPLKQGVGLEYESRMHGYMYKFMTKDNEWFDCGPDEALKHISSNAWYFKELAKKDIKPTFTEYKQYQDDKKLRFIENNA